MMTMGSLFDGIGGFPLAAQRNGIITLWASEIEPFPIRVTKLRFPEMIHLGDITKLDGAELPPVDIICGGSPCQDLSVAGARAGLAGSRSGLFMEQIRIIKEMRDADKKRGRTGLAVRPRFGYWENVPGAFSSAEGKDFRAVLQAFIGIEEPQAHVVGPPSGRWEPAGTILGVRSSLAWATWDAQYFGVPQRRRRIFLVADFAGYSPIQILFEQGRLFGDTAKGGGTREGAAAPAPGGAGASGGVFVFHINQREETIDLGGVAGALMATTNMQMQTFVAEGFDGHKDEMSTGRNGMIAFAANQRDEVRDLHDVAGALGAQPGMKQQTFIAAGIVSKGNGDCFLTPDVHTSLSGGGGQAGQGYPCILEKPGVLCLNDQGGARMGCTYDQTATLRAQARGHEPLIFENHGLDSRCTGPHKAAPTISAAYGTGGNNSSLIVEEPVYCITGNAIDRQPQNGGNGIGYQEDISYTLTATDRHSVCTRQGKDAAGSALRPVNPPRLIRRLTPLECERLQGFPDGWTEIPGASDSARYKALGNSVAIPCVEYLLRGVAFFLQNGQP